VCWYRDRSHSCFEPHPVAEGVGHVHRGCLAGCSTRRGQLFLDRHALVGKEGRVISLELLSLTYYAAATGILTLVFVYLVAPGAF
jgi:hypothetical protein